MRIAHRRSSHPARRSPPAAARASPEQQAQALDAFATVEKVFQHPRCQNCHIPGDAPLQFDAGTPHRWAWCAARRARARRACRARPATAKRTRRPATARTRRRAHRTGPCRRRTTRWPGSACPPPQLCAMIKDKKQQRRPRPRRAAQACQRGQAGAVGLGSGRRARAGVGAARPSSSPRSRPGWMPARPVLGLESARHPPDGVCLRSNGGFR